MNVAYAIFVQSVQSYGGSLEQALEMTAVWAEGADRELLFEPARVSDVPPVSENDVVAQNDRSLAELEMLIRNTGR